jgi:HSP20 family protein
MRELENFQGRLSQLFRNSPLDLGAGLLGDERGSPWMPSVDIIEDNQEYLIKAELPEVKREDVHVKVDEDTLRIYGERKMEKEEKGRKFHRVERSHGSFVRAFALPEDADASQIRAEFTNGVLNVHLAKAKEAKASREKEIEIH